MDMVELGINLQLYEKILENYDNNEFPVVLVHNDKEHDFEAVVGRFDDPIELRNNLFPPDINDSFFSRMYHIAVTRVPDKAPKLLDYYNNLRYDWINNIQDFANIVERIEKITVEGISYDVEHGENIIKYIVTRDRQPCDGDYEGLKPIKTEYSNVTRGIWRRRHHLLL